MIEANELLKKMSYQKVNYDSVLKKMIQIWEQNGIRPKILLHSCCAPCSTYSLEFLAEYADVTIYFANDNIHPRNEYERRRIVQQQFVEQFNQRTNHHVQFLSAEYKPNTFIQLVKENKLENEPEGGARCSACFHLRLDIVAKAAISLGYDYFGSALTISPKKNSQLINEIGLDIQKIYSINYLPSDFKKNKGYERSIQMCKEYDIYRQCYCGCVFAAKSQGIDLKQINQEARLFVNEQKESGMGEYPSSSQKTC
jgi:predicted adenine nucleotide alpha hydrolase (AANH) superfamily ATPase